ncbi:hypothetical protein FJY63_14215, partial [Candidatus Sumerlaeota bacterium]|nr:hypothetical protein [Candidatus Sumerlaeota bacterium]
WWDEALYYVRAAEDKGYTGKKRFRRKVRQTVADRERWTAESVAVADTERFIRTQEQLVAYEALVKALAGGNREQLRQAGLLARRRLEATPLADDVADAWSVLYEWLGDRRTALAEQRNLAASYSEAQAGQAALTRLSDPQYNPQARYKQEMARYHDRQMRYVLTGDRTARQNIELISELATPNVPQLGAAAAFFATDVLIRGLTTAFGNPVSPEDVVAAGEHLLADPRNGLTPEEETRLRLALGAIYGKLRRYDEAAATYRTARISSPELDKRLTELAADEQLRRALDSEEMNDRALLLGEVVESYPKTKAAERARDILKRLETETKVDFAIPYDWLADDPVHWMRLGARIPYNLMDGAKGNGEINQRGLVFWRDRPDVATYVCEDGKTSQVAVTAYRRAALRAAAVAWIDRKAALEEGELTLASRRLPFEVRGSAGPQGLIVFPTPRGAPLSEEDKRLFR